MTYKFKLSRRLAASQRFLGVLAAVGLAACGSESPTSSSNNPPVTPSPTAGWLTVQLTTPRTDDGAVQLSVSGPGVDSAKIVGYDGYAVVANSQANLIVTGGIASGTVARVFVRDVNKASQVQASVAAAAARGTYGLQDLTGYRVVLVR